MGPKYSRSVQPAGNLIKDAGVYSRGGLRNYYNNGMRILLVDDRDDVREAYKIMLEQLGHDLVEARSGKQAIAEAIKHLPKLIFIDLSMPELDGFQTVAALRAIPAFKNVPIIALTSYPKSEWHARAADAGCDGYFQKPVGLEHFSAFLAQYKASA